MTRQIIQYKMHHNTFKIFPLDTQKRSNTIAILPVTATTGTAGPRRTALDVATGAAMRTSTMTRICPSEWPFLTKLPLGDGLAVVGRLEIRVRLQLKWMRHMKLEPTCEVGRKSCKYYERLGIIRVKCS